MNPQTNNSSKNSTLPLPQETPRQWPAATIRTLFLRIRCLAYSKARDVSDMWQMLIERSKGNLKIEFSNVSANGDSGTAQWVATYHFSKTNRQVVNKIAAAFEFRDGLIYRHTDYFIYGNGANRRLDFQDCFWVGRVLCSEK